MIGDLSLREATRAHILRVLQIAGGRLTPAAKLLRIHRRSLQRRLRSMGYRPGGQPAGVVPPLATALHLEAQLVAIAHRAATEVAALVREQIAAEVGSLLREKRAAVHPASSRVSRVESVQADLLRVLRAAKQGLSLGEIVERSGVLRSAAMYHLRTLRRGKKVRVVGTTRGARWVAR
jgi:hypothetical protein